MRTMRLRMSLFALLAVVGLIAAACGSSSTPQVQAQDVATPGPDHDPPSDLSGLPDSSGPPLVTATTTSSSDAGKPEIVLDPVPSTSVPEPGDGPFDDPFGPGAGEEVGVIGVAFDDVLNVRSGPGVDEPVVTTLSPMGLTAATGRHQQLPGGAYWWEVTVDDIDGWAHSSYLSRLSEPVELTGVDTTMTAATLGELGLMVVESGPGGIDIGATGAIVTLALAPRGEHDLGEVVFDLTGYGDDSVSGVRLHVFARPTDDRQAFELLRVDATTMCWRAVHEGVCI